MSKDQWITIEFDLFHSDYMDLMNLSKSEEIPLPLLCSFIVIGYLEFYKKNKGFI